MSAGGNAQNARETALEVLLSLRHGAWADASLDAALLRGDLDRRDASLAVQLVYGVLQTRMMLDRAIAAASTLPLKKIAPTVTEILRLSAYQFLYLDKIPVSAAVNEAVEMARRHANPRAAAFVNAVLRKVAHNGLPDVPDTDPVERLSVITSHPRDLVERLLADHDFATVEAVLRANNAPVPTVLRLNILHGTPDAIRTALAEAGLPIVPDETLPTAVTLEGAGRIPDLPAFRDGLITAQDRASQLAAIALGARPGEEVLDVCAAPGGKSFHLAALMGNRGRVVACDVFEGKLRHIDEGAARLGATIIETAPLDATRFEPRFEGRFDRVLADVPCSGLGVIRKKPDIRYRDLAEAVRLPRLQSEILLNAARYVRPGGTLLYSTCTLLRAENEAVVEAFLETCSDFAPEPFALPGVGECDGLLSLFPHIHGTDGFFMAKLRKST